MTNAKTPKIHIIPFQPGYQQAAKDLILTGLVEHWGFLDETKNPDLDNISKAYAKGKFLVALIGDDLVGTGAYLPRSPSVVEIVRMSVHVTHRRKGIGRKILTALCQHALRDGFDTAILETTRTWGEVIRFYQESGFTFTHYDSDDAYFSLNLSSFSQNQ
jgi:GNAT superfamily N-acetyltransferase